MSDAGLPQRKPSRSVRWVAVSVMFAATTLVISVSHERERTPIAADRTERIALLSNDPANSRVGMDRGFIRAIDPRQPDGWPPTE